MNVGTSDTAEVSFADESTSSLGIFADNAKNSLPKDPNHYCQVIHRLGDQGFKLVYQEVSGQSLLN